MREFPEKFAGKRAQVKFGLPVAKLGTRPTKKSVQISRVNVECLCSWHARCFSKPRGMQIMFQLDTLSD